MPERRQLSFASLDEVIREVEGLLAGCESVGQWTLGQICRHLTTGLDVVIDGVPGFTSSTQPEDPRYARIRERFFQAGRFPDGAKAPLPQLVPGSVQDDRAEAEALRGALDRFRAAPGPFFPHPFLGSMTKEEWIQFHCLHAAHHLGFVVPRPAG